MHKAAGVFRTLRAADLIVLVIILLGASTACPEIFAMRDPVTMFALVMGRTCPAARRLMSWRRQGASERRWQPKSDAETMALVTLGFAPWLLVPVVIHLHDTALLAPLGFPTGLRWSGAFLTLCGVLRSIWWAGARADSGITSGVIEGIGLFVVSASPLIGVLAAGGLASRLSTARAMGPRSA